MGNRLIYLASPIDYADSAEVAILHSEAQKYLGYVGFVVYDPSYAWDVPSAANVDHRIEQINNHALLSADGVLALLPDGVRSIGVPMEIERAHSNNIPCCVVGSYTSVSLAGLRNLGREHTVENAVDWLADNVVASVQYSQGLRVQGEGQLPTKSYADDAGWDIYAHHDIYIRPGEVQDVRSGISVQLPDNYWCMIVGRSSAFRKRGLIVNTGIIDGGFRGELFATTRNVSSEEVLVARGERIAQVIPFHNAGHNIEPIRVERLDDSDRGQSGFGSSGS